MRLGAVLLLLVVTGSAEAAEAPRRFPVYFQEWSAALDGSAQAVIKEAADFAAVHPAASVQVHGYADQTGNRESNVLSSQLRAQRVTDQLNSDGIPLVRIRQDGRGAVKFAITSQESRRAVVEIAPR